MADLYPAKEILNNIQDREEECKFNYKKIAATFSWWKPLPVGSEADLQEVGGRHVPCADGGQAGTGQCGHRRQPPVLEGLQGRWEMVA